MFLLVGLGNPGIRYQSTRHNVGFDLVDDIAAEAGSTLNSARFKALYGKGSWSGFDFIFLKPQTFMNVSGDSVLEAAQFFKIPINHVVVVFDDLDQAPGAVRLRSGGGHGGHNGIRDIIAKLGSDAFHRIKIGIGKPEHKSATADWVLGKFTAFEESTLRIESFPIAKDRLRSLIERLP
jgi:peptidyl-tRNA hydrolase, PTH1 family